MKLAITVNLTKADGTAAAETTTIEVEVPDFEDFTGPERFAEVFDSYERTVLKARNEAIEAATEKYLSELVKKKPPRGRKPRSQGRATSEPLPD